MVIIKVHACAYTFIGQLLDTQLISCNKYLILLALPRGLEPLFSPERARFGALEVFRRSEPLRRGADRGFCPAIGLHLLIEPVTRPLASWNVVTPLLFRARSASSCDRHK